ncbi:MAG: GNAT family N-acetyltransferase [Anaerolineae bacterium]|nr:GNAT family N-acetyltransferase [Anaerolineae bacterium]
MASIMRKRYAQTGVRPFDPYRDLGAVAELIDVAFGDSLDPAGRAALAEMRRAARWGIFWGWLYQTGWSSEDLPPGFVWVEKGRVVGNVSLRRTPARRGFLVGNVAVHPDWQGRGIARALMEAALDEIASLGGQWVGLEVEADNQVARRLYERLQFVGVSRTLHMLRPAGLPWGGEIPRGPSLRRGRRRDSKALVDLVQAVIPEYQRPLLELRLADYHLSWERALDHFLEGRREVWWVIEEEGAVRAAVRVLRECRGRPDRLEFLISPEYGGRFADILVRRALSSLPGTPKKMIEVLLPNPDDSLVAMLRKAGFQELRVLIQMRRDLAADTPRGCSK